MTLMPLGSMGLIEEYLKQAGGGRGAALRNLVNGVCAEYARISGVEPPVLVPGPGGVPLPQWVRDAIAVTSPEEWAWAVSGAAPGADGAQGSVSTSPSLARYMCRLALSEYAAAAGIAGDATGLSPSVIDPATGGGVFLLAMASEILECGGLGEGGPLERSRALGCVSGVDVDGQCVDSALAAAWLWCLGRQGRGPVAVRRNVFAGDSLLEPDGWWTAGPGAPGSFDILVANPPYVRQELVGAERKAALSERYPGFGGRSDMYARFFVLAGRLLKPGGVAVVVTPSSWMDVDYGTTVKGYLLDNFDLRSVVASSKTRLFQQASINAQVTVVRKRERRAHGRGGGMVRFITIGSTAGSGWPHVDPAAAETTEIGQESLRPEAKWGVFLRAPKVYFDLVDRALDGSKPSFCRLGDLASVSFGTKTGANEYFYLRDASETADGRILLNSMGNPPGVRAMRSSRALHGAGLAPIESRFLTPVVKSLREVPGYAVDPSNVSLLAFNAGEKPPGEFAAEYIRGGEVAGYAARPTCRGRSPWYRLPCPPAGILYSMSWGSRMGVVIHSRECLYDARFYGLEAREGIDPLLLAAVLNTTCTWLFTELSGRPMTGNLPLLDIKIYEVEQLPVLDVRSLDGPRRRGLCDCMLALMRRGLLDITREIALDDRRRLDTAVLRLAGYECCAADRLAAEIAGGVATLVTQRISKSGLVLC